MKQVEGVKENNIPPHFEIQSIAVLKSYQGLGIGKALIEKINEVISHHNEELLKEGKSKKGKKKAKKSEETEQPQSQPQETPAEVETNPKTAAFVSVKTPKESKGFFEKFGFSVEKEEQDVAFMKKTL